MQRRKIDAPLVGSNVETTAATDSARPPVTMPAVTRPRRSSTRSAELWFILLAVIFMGAVTVLSPATVKGVERELIRDAYKAEKQVEDWLQTNKVIPVTVEDRKAAGFDPSEAMKRQPSKWVDGEKKLKEKLRVLEARQKEKLDLNVPILTRFLGDDFPAWVPKDGDVEGWTKKRDAKYAEMAEEEKLWKAAARKVLGLDGS